ncbi:MAG: class I SAM-dependent methyltransferase [Pseudomonadota bacterium]
MVDRVGMAQNIGGHALRFGWFFGINRLVDREASRHGAQRTFKPTKPVPERGALFAALRDLTLRDANAVGEGLQPPVQIEPSQFGSHLGRLRAMLRDLPGAVERRADSNASSARELADADGLPDYFTQDFHYQTGGYLTDESASLYDAQVETLFYGSAALMRRAAARHVLSAVVGRDQRKLALADVACGTGRFLREVRGALPALKLTGIDLSEAYLTEARRHMQGVRPAEFIFGNAEKLPLEDASQDIVTCIFLFHELPPEVRRRVTAEFARVLKPGGTLVFMDSLQMGDRPDWDGMIEAFPVRFHEPYYRHYAIDDLDDVFSAAGLAPHVQELAFLSKIMVRRKA